MKSFIQEFKAFIMRGNMIELAVGLMMGTAFTALITAFTQNIITPILDAIIGMANVEFSTLNVVVLGATIQFGAFIQALINFVITAFVLFLMIKSMNKLVNLKTKEEPEVVDAAPTIEELLIEIRDELKNNNK